VSPSPRPHRHALQDQPRTGSKRSRFGVRTEYIQTWSASLSRPTRGPRERCGTLVLP
jgi:hypothetical protein